MDTNNTSETIVGVFTNRNDAQQAVDDLYQSGFTSNNVGLVAKKDGGTTGDGDEATTGAVAGATVGALGGAAIGAGIAAGIIPVIGPVLAIGTLGTVLINAAGGAAALGIAGALTGWGVSDDDAKYYESEVNNGKYLVTVETNSRFSEAQAILQRHGGSARREWQNQAMGIELVAGSLEKAKSRRSSSSKGCLELRAAVPSKFDYTLDFKNIDFRQKRDLYQIGKGEQGVLLVEPYKSEILPHWKFKTVADAKKSSARIYRLFLSYLRAGDFPGADMARKFLQMGWTRARRYANHKSGRKYDGKTGLTLPRIHDAEKARAAAIFYERYVTARENPKYRQQRTLHLTTYEHAK